ncbi:MAG: ABC transporter substrate-binding protein, partial [Desulfomonile tiedjei]|nr:ABC transporter substrate-binding protein [Desulfomonile tiedjei]
MNGKPKILLAAAALLAVLFFTLPPANAAEKPIVIGSPLATSFLYGWDAEKAIKLAVEEINAAGGVKVGSEKRP